MIFAVAIIYPLQYCLVPEPRGKEWEDILICTHTCLPGQKRWWNVGRAFGLKLACASKMPFPWMDSSSAITLAGGPCQRGGGSGPGTVHRQTDSLGKGRRCCGHGLVGSFLLGKETGYLQLPALDLGLVSKCVGPAG